MKDAAKTKKQLIKDLIQARQRIDELEAHLPHELETERKRAEARLEAICRLGGELTLLRDVSAIVRHVLDTAAHLLRFEVATCGLVDEATGELRYCYVIPGTKGASLPLAGGEARGISLAVVRSGQALSVPDTRQDPYGVSSPGDRSNRSELCVPMKVGGRVIGVLNARSVEPNHFTPADEQLLRTLANQAAVALENARLLTEAQRGSRKLAALNKASRAMVSSLDLDTVLDHIIEQLVQVVDYDSTALILVVGDKLTIQAARGFEEPDRILATISDIADNPLFREILESHRPIIIPDVRTDDRFRRWAGTGSIRSWIGVPLIVRDRVIGQLAVDKHQPDFYDEGDAELIFTFARQAAIAIENARLHTETERRAAQLTVLHELDQAITASLRIDDVYYALAHHTARLLPHDRMSIASLEGDDMCLTYVVGQAETRLPLKTSAVGWVVAQGQPLLRHNVAADMRFAEDEHLVAAGIRSVMIIPLRVKGQVIGTWKLDNRQVGAYSPEDLIIAQPMADQLAIAIENARLYEAEREQYRRLQQSQAQLIQVEKMAALGRLVASFAHEINNPLQSVQGCLELAREELADSRRPAELDNFLGIATSEIERIAAIVHRMRDFYRPPHQGEQAPPPDTDTIDDFYRPACEELQVVDLHAILEDVLKLANKQLQHSLVSVERCWADPAIPMIQGNPDHLKQVFLNLVLNAIDAIDGHGGTLHVRTALSEAQRHSNQPVPAVRIEFSDTGQGMPPETLSRLFEPFFTTKEQGSGLGLATSYRIIEAHNGQITATSQVGMGTTFTILLPVKQPEQGVGFQCRETDRQSEKE